MNCGECSGERFDLGSKRRELGQEEGNCGGIRRGRDRHSQRASDGGRAAGGERDEEAEEDEDDERELGGNKEETSALGKRQRRAQSMMIPAKNGILMSSALVEGRITEGGGALENGKATMISGPRLSSSPMRCNWAVRDSSAAEKDGSKSDRRA